MKEIREFVQEAIATAVVIAIFLLILLGTAKLLVVTAGWVVS